MATHDAPAEDRPSGAYADAHARSLRDPEGFWLDAARAIDSVSYTHLTLPTKRIV